MSAATLGGSAPNRHERRTDDALRATAEALAEVFSDFVAFCELLEIRDVNGKGLKKFNWSTWHSEQRTWQKTRSGRDIVLKPRQVGFSTIELARDLWYAITRPGYQVLVITHDEELKKSLFLTVRMFADGLKRRGLLPKLKYSTTTELVFADTGSAVRIVEAGKTEGAAQSKGRSGTIHRLHATEMAFWEQAETTWGAVYPAVPDDGEIVIESTANGASGLFYQLIQEARDGKGGLGLKFHFFPWYKQRRFHKPFVPGDFDPTPKDRWERKLRAAGVTDQQIAWWRSRFESVDMGPDKTLRDYPVDSDSCFRAAGRQYFHPDVIDDLFEKIKEPLEKVELRWTPKKGPSRSFGELLVYQRYKPNCEYVVGGDVSEGTGEDASAATVIEKRTGLVCATFWSDSIEPGDFGIAMALIGRMYGDAKLAPERNNHGHAAIRAIHAEADYPIGRVYDTDDGKLGWLTSSVTRPVMIDDLGNAIREGVVSTPDRKMANECKALVRNDKGKVEARGKGNSGGAKDDTWMSWCIAWQVRNAPEVVVASFTLPSEL